MEREAEVNVKQIGSISKGSKIYIEDYVMTFIKYMEERFVCEELIFMLLGKLKKEDDEDVLFISGAVEGRKPSEEVGIKTFSEEDKSYGEKIREKYFSGLDIVGWAYIQPGYGDFLNEAQVNYHLSVFDKPHQVLYIADPLDRSCVFYRKKPNSPELKPINGYFIYYDKNEAMQEYMIECKKEYASKGSEEEKEGTDEKSDTGKKVRDKPTRNKYRNKDSGAEPNRLVNLLGGLSFALLFVTLIIGGGLLRSNSRIELLEKQINSLGETCIALQEELVQTKEVFALNSTDDMTDSGEVTENITEKASEEAIANEQTVEAAAPEDKTYTVKSGDTLIKISKNFYGNSDRVEDIMKANGIDSPSGLIEGKTIIIPK